MVVVDKLSKETHFIPVKTTYKAANIVDIFLKQIFSFTWNTKSNNFRQRP